MKRDARDSARRPSAPRIKAVALPTGICRNHARVRRHSSSKGTRMKTSRKPITPGKLAEPSGPRGSALRTAEVSSRAELHTTGTRVAVELRSTGAAVLVVLRRDAAGHDSPVLFRVSIRAEPGLCPRPQRPAPVSQPYPSAASPGGCSVKRSDQRRAQSAGGPGHLRAPSLVRRPFQAGTELSDLGEAERRS
jgi:hypothetical protein